MFGQKRQPNKEEWLREAEKAYDKVFGQRDGARKGGRPVTFSEIEEEAVQEGNKLARCLLEGRISMESEESGCQGETCSCPHCGKTAKRKREDLDTRELRARPGRVSVDRYEYYCCSCRRSFFPLWTSSWASGLRVSVHGSWRVWSGQGATRSPTRRAQRPSAGCSRSRSRPQVSVP